MGNLDARHFVHLPRWTKLVALTLLFGGLLASAIVIYAFFDSGGSRDWVLLGISGGQFMLTTFVVALILFYSQTDANIVTLRKSADQFLSKDGALGIALGKVTLADGTPLIATRDDAPDLFGHAYALTDPDRTVRMRLWCGLNVNRFIVIYYLRDPRPAADGNIDRFVERLRQIFSFSLGSIDTLGYKISYEPVPGDDRLVSLWLTVTTNEDLLTNPALKLFWSQDIAMMTQSLLRTALRHPEDVRLEIRSAPAPL